MNNINLQAIAALIPAPNVVTSGEHEVQILATLNDGTVKHYEGFYISYNIVDKSYYGSDTTALVIGQMQLFFILKGDHTKRYSGKNLAEALKYYKDNIQLSVKSDDINKFVSIKSA